ncbi:MAG: ogr/Delta-like zinc finger family protein [Proteobacteria bacterium]|nr:ogr/Delta-like zinc finger family protein [Pseudomonadota bacterium]
MGSSEAVVVALAKVQEGVDYSPVDGARCPLCGERMAVVTTRKWAGQVRVRYHKCENQKCVAAKLGSGVKSVELRES